MVTAGICYPIINEGLTPQLLGVLKTEALSYQTTMLNCLIQDYTSLGQPESNDWLTWEYNGLLLAQVRTTLKGHPKFRCPQSWPRPLLSLHHSSTSPSTHPVSFPSAILNKPLAIHLLLSLLPKTNSTYSIHQNTVTKNTDVFQVSSLLWMILNKHQYIHYPTCLHHYLLKDKQKIIYKTLLTVRGQNPVFQPGPRCPEFD